MPSTPGHGRRLGVLTGALIAGAVLTLPAGRLGAQGSLRDTRIAPFSSIYATTGTMLMDVSKLNPHFERADLPPAERPGFFTLSNDGYSLGVGGYGAVVNRLMLGAEWHVADIGQEASPSGKTNALTTRYAMVTGGLAAWTSWRINVIPFLGIGTGSATLTLKNRSGGPTVSTAQDPTFDEVIASPGSVSRMKGAYVMVQPGVAIDYLVLRQEMDRLGVVLGLRVASLISPNRTTWKYEGREVFGGPDLGPTGGVVRILVGVGGFRLGGSPGR